jgi:hypothetical protein
MRAYTISEEFAQSTVQCLSYVAAMALDHARACSLTDAGFALTDRGRVRVHSGHTPPAASPEVAGIVVVHRRQGAACCGALLAQRLQCPQGSCITW